MKQMKEALKAKDAKVQFTKSTEKDRENALNAIAIALQEHKQEIIKENRKDILNGKEIGLNASLIDRLLLDEKRIDSMITGVKNIIGQDPVVGEITESQTREDGLIIEKQRIPLGVIGMIFESRPNVVIDCSCLAIKSGNCIILKGGKEAIYSNKVLARIVRKAISNFVPVDTVQLIDSRDDVNSLLTQVGLVDVIIPRGGEKLIEFVSKNSRIPVIAHFKGLCHIFIDKCADQEKSLNIVMNAKTQRPGVCNAVETLLLHKDLPISFIDKLFMQLTDAGTEIRICPKTETSLTNLTKAQGHDWETEYLDNILSVKTVLNTEEAIKHIQKYGSHHSEAILSKTDQNILNFMNEVDASSVMINASTRFNDGSEYGLGAELGISTTKLHAYGPMGAKEMTTQRYVVRGNGHIRK